MSKDLIVDGSVRIAAYMLERALEATDPAEAKRYTQRAYAAVLSAAAGVREPEQGHTEHVGVVSYLHGLGVPYRLAQEAAPWLGSLVRAAERVERAAPDGAHVVSVVRDDK